MPPGSVLTVPEELAQEEPGQSEPALVASTGETAPASCDVSACSRMYRSFRESDCTYQPFEGPRRLCTQASAGFDQAPQPTEPVQEFAASVAVQDPTRSVPLATCNYRACSLQYRSFRPSDCTYQPFSGPRQLCER